MMSAARAGTWQVTYASSGSAQDHHISGNPNNIVAGSAAWTDTPGETSAPASGAAGGQYAVDASTSGSVTATLLWQPATGQTLQTDPPPACVIVAQTASASASGGNGPNSPYSASDGLGDATVPAGGVGSASSSGTHYSAQNGRRGRSR